MAWRDTLFLDLVPRPDGGRSQVLSFLGAVESPDIFNERFDQLAPLTAGSVCGSDGVGDPQQGLMLGRLVPPLALVEPATQDLAHGHAVQLCCSVVDALYHDLPDAGFKQVGHHHAKASIAGAGSSLLSDRQATVDAWDVAHRFQQ